MICASCHSTEAVTGETRCARCAPVTPFVPPSPPLRSPVGLGQATVVMLGLVGAGDVVAIWADLAKPSLLTGLVLDNAQGALLLATAVVYLCWLWRIRANADVFDASSQSLARWWTIGGWFVPIVNFWFPRRIVLDAWDAGAPQGRPAGHGLVDLWWTAWVAGLIADRLLRVGSGAGMLAVVDGIDLVAAVLAAAVVLRLTRMQNEKALQGPSLPSAALG
ncbi:uncharacterized protein DUF4328 [Streptomyces sp. BK022]|uniref:DUF4328 domain-containing protein n=1 Tax=Streptomyces sp. BK022 TaxID=2512123 RepID=UPI0010297FF9|nr:DUF4328 domain-containing protein [Streptomyces sp. BK022]RZU44086.1 uncharacterized protein DUF4328 [Streptomyces sp. BK022]